METTETHSEDETRDGAAGGTSCLKPHLTAAGAAALLGAIILVNALVLNLVLFASQRAKPEKDQTLKPSGEDQLEKLHQCQRQNQDLNLMLQSVVKDSRCSLCPAGWRWWRNHCYFFSVQQEENLKWNESAEFCRRHGSSLLVIKDSAEMVTNLIQDFLQREMKEFTPFPFLWVGLTDHQEEGQWLWWDGTDVRHYLQSATVEWDTEERDCADLRAGGSLFAAECDVYGPWVCKKQS